jgi:uncharacterized membrane protein
MYDPNSVRTLSKGPITAVYALYALSFFMGITSFIGVLIAHIKKDDAKDSWLYSHYKWQIRSFWWTFLWCIVGTVLLFVGIGYLIILAALGWFIYRITKGWLRLLEDRPMD